MKIFSKKTLVLALSLVMALSFSLTAFAANESMTAEQKVSEAKAQFYSDVTAVNGKIAAITDETVLAEAYDRFTETRDKIETQYGKGIITGGTFVFDVTEVASGQVSFYLKDQGNFAVSKIPAEGTAAVVMHRKSDGTWETMDKLAEVTKDGLVTIEFSSYSPIMVMVLDSTPSGVEKLAATTNPTYKSTTSPDTNDLPVAPIAVAVFALAAAGVVAVTKKAH